MIFTILIALFAYGSGNPVTRKVPSQYASIQSAVDVSSEGDTVLVAPGVYHENIRLHGPNITLTSHDPRSPDIVAATILNGGGIDSVITLTGDETRRAVIEGFTITNGYSDKGGGIFGGEPSVSGAIASKPTVRYNVVVGNHAVTAGGGIASCDGPIYDNVVISNTTDRSGAGIWHCDGKIRFNRIADNKAGYQGGGLCGCWGTIEHNLIYNNFADVRGGGINLANTTSSVIRFNTIVRNETADRGGALWNCLGEISHCIIWDNRSPNRRIVDDNAAPTYCCVDEVIPAPGNIHGNPRFFDPDNADFHLMSSVGRWDPQRNLWKRDTVSSPCLDAGDPLASVGDEPMPNGGSVNLGCFAGTEEASKSFTPSPNLAPVSRRPRQPLDQLWKYVQPWIGESYPRRRPIPANDQ